MARRWLQDDHKMALRWPKIIAGARDKPIALRNELRNGDATPDVKEKRQATYRSAQAPQLQYI